MPVLSPRELGLLAKKPAGAKDDREAARLTERLARGFYGIDLVKTFLLPGQAPRGRRID